MRPAPVFPKVMRHVFALALQEEAVRRLDILIGSLVLWVPILFHVLLWSAIYEASPNANVQLGYTQAQTVTYFVMALLSVRIVMTNIYQVLNQQILDGDMNRFLLQPVSHFGYHLMRYLAQSATKAAYMLIPVTVLAVVFSNNLIRPHFLEAALALTALLLGLLLNFIICYGFGLLGFWFGRAEQLTYVLVTLTRLLDGSLFPIDFLPPALAQVLHFFPFQYIIYFPVRLFIGAESAQSTATGFALQGAWILVTVLVVRLAWRRGTKRYGAFGG